MSRKLASSVQLSKDHEHLLTSEINNMKGQLYLEIKIVKDIAIQVKHAFLGLQRKILVVFHWAQETRKLCVIYAHHLA